MNDILTNKLMVAARRLVCGCFLSWVSLGGLLTLTTVAQAGTVYITFVSNSGVKQGNQWVGPECLTVNGMSTNLVCDDMTHSVRAGDAWTAYETVGLSDLSHVRFGGGLQAYGAAAWLTQYGTYNPTQWGNANFALWALFTPSAAKSDPGWTAGAQALLTTATNQTYTASQFPGFRVYTPVSPYCYQEFVAIPEPGSALLVGTGLMGLMLSACRKRQAVRTSERDNPERSRRASSSCGNLTLKRSTKERNRAMDSKTMRKSDALPRRTERGWFLSWVSLAVFLAFTSVAQAGTVYITFVSPSGVMQGNQYVGPHNVTVDGQATKLVCDDITHVIDPGDAWTANVTAGLGDLSQTRFAGGLQAYGAAAWLTEYGMNHPAQWGDANFAMWALFTPAYAKNDPGWTAGAQALLTTATNQTYTTSQFPEFRIYTPVSPTVGQEFVTIIPEPGSALLLGSGLAGLMLFARRKR